MWLLSFLSDSVLELIIRMILIIGAASFVLGLITKWIPFLGSKSLVLRIIGLALLFPGLYLWGGYGVEMEYRAAAEAWKAKIEILEAKSQQENREIEEKIVKDTKIIKQDTDATLAEIEKLREQIDSQCELTPDMIDLYNKGIIGGTK